MSYRTGNMKKTIPVIKKICFLAICFFLQACGNSGISSGSISDSDSPSPTSPANQRVTSEEGNPIENSGETSDTDNSFPEGTEKTSISKKYSGKHLFRNSYKARSGGNSSFFIGGLPMPSALPSKQRRGKLCLSGRTTRFSRYYQWHS